MSATPARGALPPDALAAMKKENGFLHILRHGTGADSIYIVTYHRLEGSGGSTAPQAVEGARGLIELFDPFALTCTSLPCVALWRTSCASAPRLSRTFGCPRATLSRTASNRPAHNGRNPGLFPK